MDREQQVKATRRDCENHVIAERGQRGARHTAGTLSSCPLPMSKLQARREPFDPALEDEVAQPRNGLIYSTFAASINFFRPYAPQIVPIIVCAFFIPVTLALSGFAGWVVWSSLSTGWEAPLYLQYGYVNLLDFIVPSTYIRIQRRRCAVRGFLDTVSAP